MPSLNTITSATTHVNGNVLVWDGPVLNTAVPTDPGGGSPAPVTILRSTTGLADVLNTITIPTGKIVFQCNRQHFDTNASPSNAIMTANGGIFIGDGTPQSLIVRCPNPQTGVDYTLQSGIGFSTLFVINSPNIKSVIPNPW
jgi:hypothetical protein